MVVLSLSIHYIKKGQPFKPCQLQYEHSVELVYSNMNTVLNLSIAISGYNHFSLPVEFLVELKSQQVQIGLKFECCFEHI